MKKLHPKYIVKLHDFASASYIFIGLAYKQLQNLSENGSIIIQACLLMQFFPQGQVVELLKYFSC